MSMTYRPDTTWDVKAKNFATSRRDALVKLIKDNISGFADVQPEALPITRQGAIGQKFPVAMVYITDEDSTLDTNGKYTMKAGYAIMVANAGNQPASVKDDIVFGMASIRKLLSNNAYTDIDTAATYRYMTYPNYWNQSTLGPAKYSLPVPFQSDASSFWLIRAVAQFDIEWIALQ